MGREGERERQRDSDRETERAEVGRQASTQKQRDTGQTNGGGREREIPVGRWAGEDGGGG